MAAGEAAGAPGTEWITAAVIAYEVHCRLCDAACIRTRGWDHTTYGSVSATLAAARLGHLDHARTVHALGIAGTTGTALRLTRAGELSMWKGCAFAFAARNAVFAAARGSGLDRPLPLFEGAMGVMEQVSGPLEISSLAGRMLPTGCCREPRSSLFPPSITASRQSQQPSSCGPGSETPATSAHRDRHLPHGRRDHRQGSLEKWCPRTRETADHSLPYCTVALLSMAISAAQFTDERLSDPLLLDLIERTRVIEDPALTARYPDAVPNRLTVILADGTHLVHELSHPPGHAHNPLSDVELSAKFHGLADPVLGPQRAAEIRERIVSLECDPAPHEVLRLTGG